MLEKVSYQDSFSQVFNSMKSNCCLYMLEKAYRVQAAKLKAGDYCSVETYYFYCEPYEKGLTLMADIKLIDKEAAENYMSELKEQPGSLVD